MSQYGFLQHVTVYTQLCINYIHLSRLWQGEVSVNDGLVGEAVVVRHRGRRELGCNWAFVRHCRGGIFDFDLIFVQRHPDTLLGSGFVRMHEKRSTS